ncbi:thiolase domain-containing protein [Actinocorallia sp. A-T 12471]|uniref:thiolase domain-containing protein n=1 Tax=Actinocorallia sp. A-T 12471 TaxID=3089813 RepID=UPI0029CF8D04|nr:thiolase domain-containing protein [Actinocorallia sp. A-T 12471]MDX6740935.1 thiolase domain-containing protein [Actinocorallia sp. A-T 12471]
MGRRCAVVGIGQTDYRRRLEVSLEGLVRWAALAALEDAGLTFADIDAVVLGKAPDLLEGVMMPELTLADALGAVGKPIHRVHTAGSVGAATAISGATLVESGRYERVLVVAYEKQSEGNATWALSGGKSGGQGAGGTFAPWIRHYIRRSGAPEHIGWKVAVKDRRNALRNPHAHLRIPDISQAKVRESPMLWEPLHFLESCPSSDGAAAVVLASEDAARRGPSRPAWVVAHAKRSEFASFPGRDPVRPQAGVDCAEALYRKAGITDPLRQIDCAELYVPFSWYEPMWLEGHLLAAPGEGWKLTDSGATELGGSFPVNPSGGVLSSNPIGASGLVRCLEAARQVRGSAGDHQVDGARVALGHAYGGAAQYFAMWIVSADPDPVFA